MVYTVTTGPGSAFYCFPPLTSSGPSWKLVLALALLLTWFILFRYLLEEVIFRNARLRNYNPNHVSVLCGG